MSQTPPPPIDPSAGSRPQVARAITNRGVWLFGGAMAAVAAVLFGLLETRRAAEVNPAVTLPASGTAIGPASGMAAPSASTPELVIPDSGPAAPYPAAPASPNYGGGFAPSAALAGIARAPRVPALWPPRTLPGVPSAPHVVQPGYYPGPPIRINPPRNTIASPPAGTGAAGAEPSPPANAGDRVVATRLLHPASTVPQGALIPAVLETALDSTRPGFARALVTRDVRGFDGSHVLIQRGSRLFGAYKADMALGQNRAAIQWKTLTRPDGVQVALESPAVDPLGRAGVQGRVNTHFLSRFGATILQSALDIGVDLATSAATSGTVIVGLPGSTQSVTPTGQQDKVQPTLKVRQGTSIAIIVANDLDFASVEP